LKVPVSVHPELREHTRLFDKKIHKVADNVYVAVGWGIANIIMVDGTDGVVIMDTGQNLQQAMEVLAEFRRISEKPVAAVVLTHHHNDHVLGTTGFVAPEAARAGTVPIFAHESLVAEFVTATGITAELQSIRSAHMFGSSLSADDVRDTNAGIGPPFVGGPSGFLAPNRVFKDALETTVAGIRMQMVFVPGEAESEIAVYLPDNKVLVGADVVADHAYPNIYTLRGAKFRDPMQWCRSIDVLRSFDADDLALHHGPPVYGHEAVATVLTNYRDAIQFTHDQTIRHMNKGLTPLELANTVALPPHLDTFSPWLRQYYGTVKHSVRQIYHGQVGWFEGDPVALDPTPPVEYARRLVALLGGREKLLAEARRAFTSGDPQFAAELTTFLVRIDHEDWDARHLKAAAFRTLGYAQINATWRSWYLTSAMDLDGTFPTEPYLARVRAGLGSADAIARVPPSMQIGSLPTRLKAEDVVNVRMTAGFRYTDAGEDYTIEIRRGVAEVRQGVPANPTVLVEGDRKALAELMTNATTLDVAVKSGRIMLTGSIADAERFFGYFERRYAEMPQVTVR
jgi:alkyl sulfatase BDS1-like metallo-beta-lactamase superfamily hydrolase